MSNEESLRPIRGVSCGYCYAGACHKAKWGREVRLHSFLVVALNAGQQLASCFSRFTEEEIIE